MDPAPLSPDITERAVSPEGSSTRPNPFADAEDSSRKRRRTSPSDSPIATHGAVNLVNPHPSSTTIDLWALPDLPSDTAMNVDDDPAGPRTPERQLASNQQDRAEPPSSNVTLNLRHRQTSSPHSSSSPVREPLQREATGHAMSEADQLKRSVEDLEPDAARLPKETLVAPLSSSSASTSPPIEVITIRDDDDEGDADMVSDAPNAAVSIADDDEPLVDPTYQFPYRDSSDSLSETVQRLCQYISTQSPIDGNVLLQVQEWLDLYLQFARHVDRRLVLESCRAHGHFWSELPDVIQALACRRSSLLKSSVRHIVKDLYLSFAILTARFVAFDFHTVRGYMENPALHDRRGPALLSVGFLQKLHFVTVRDEAVVDTDLIELPDTIVEHLSFAPCLINKLLTSPGGSFDCLARFAALLTRFVADCPRFADALAPVGQMLADCLSEALRVLVAGHGDVAGARHSLQLGHTAWTVLSHSLRTTIEKHIVCLSSESTKSQVQALTGMLRICLQGEHNHAAEVLQSHRQNHPDLAPKHSCEAIALEWRLNTFTALIRSSQMQLRVMAVSTMCTDLVSVWKRLYNADEDRVNPFLDHIGQHLLETQLIDYILGPNCHPEIIVESANVVGFLVVTKLYRKRHTDQLWQGIVSSQDPRVADALTRMVTTIANLFDYDGLLELCEKFQSLPIDAFNPGIRAMWDFILRELLVKCEKEHKILGFLPYDLCLRLIRESSVCAPGSQVAFLEVHNATLKMFRDLLKYGPDADGRLELYNSCIRDVCDKTPTTLGSLWCLSLAIRPMLIGEMQVLTERHGLARLIVEELEHAIQIGQEAGVPAVLSGATNQPRREFITNIMLLHPAAIDNYLGTKLWNILVGPHSPCREDRQAGWQILITVGRRELFRNSFLKACVSQHLPVLPPVCFCDGTLQFIKEEIFSLVDSGANDLVLDDEAMVRQSGIEQLWRIILAADNTYIVGLATVTLAADLYLDSRTIMAYPPHRTQRVHLSLVDRCLHQLKDAARRMKASSDGTSSGDDEPMVIVTTDDEMRQQERMFTRSLQVLRYFLEAHQSRPHFAAPDVRSLMSTAPFVPEGDPMNLKYQSFDGDKISDIKPLSIGRLNTAAALLACLSQETGFENYVAYYGGQQLLPTEYQTGRSLRDLNIRDALILVKRADGPQKSFRIRPGASPLEIEILAHFEEMWGYLTLEEHIAKEIYAFLVKLPADGHILELIENDATSCQDLFPPGQPYKSLYAIHALSEYTSTARSLATGTEVSMSLALLFSAPYGNALRRTLRLLVQAISDESIIEKTPPAMQMQLMDSLMHTYEQLLKEVCSTEVSISIMENAGIPSPGRLVAVLSSAIDATCETANKLISNTLATILRLGLLNRQFWESTTSEPRFATLMHSLILFDIRQDNRSAVERLIQGAMEAEDATVASVQPTSTADASAGASHAVTKYFWSIFTALLPKAVSFPHQCQQFFEIFQLLLSKMATIMSHATELPQLARLTSELLLNHSAAEKIDQAMPLDFVAKGLACILHLCLHAEGLSVVNSMPEDVAEKLFWRHLFPTQQATNNQSVSQVVLNSDTRGKLYDIVFRLTGHDERKLRPILLALQRLEPFYMSVNDDDYLYDLPYQFERSKAVRSPCGYVGLRNLSNTCYLNSLLAQLYMNTEFRRFMVNSTTQDPMGSQQLLHHTQRLFGCMQESYRRYVDPTDVVSSIKTYDDTPVDIHSQMDVDEFYSLLFDRWEGQLIGGNDKKKLRSFYGGHLVQQVKSKECEHISERLEPFSAIQCDIKGKTTLNESLQAYVDGEVLEGDNKYKCSTCDRHVDAVKRACLKDVPDNLIFHLKRFDFNLRTLQRSKINDYFSFPPRIDLRPYTIEHLSDSKADDTEDIFELVGVLVHSGTAESGHYYSYIRERPSSSTGEDWVEFNDDVVSKFDPESLGNSTFGGPDSRPLYETNGILYDKTYSAYMLFYQRATSVRHEQQAMSQQCIPAPLHVEVDQNLKNDIINENTVLLRRHCLFDPNHTEFVQNCFSQAGLLTAASDATQELQDNFEGYLNRHDLKDLAMEMAIGHLDQVVSRAKDLKQLPSFSKMLHIAMSECHHCAMAFYDYFNLRHGAFRTLVQRHPDGRVRIFVGEAFMTAVKMIKLHLPHIYDPKDSNALSAGSDSDDDDNGADGRLSGSDSEYSVLEGVVLILGSLWRHFQANLRSWDDYFGVVVSFARLGEREAAHLLADDYLAKLLRIVSADQMMEMPPNYVRMLNNVLRRINSRPPSYLSIIAAIHHLLRQLAPVLSPDVIVETPSERLNMARPFSWTSGEVELVHQHSKRQPISLFAEKLVSIDQSSALTNEIIKFLVSTGKEGEFRILNMLRKNTQADISTQAMDPFFRAAGNYLDCTQSEVHARSLIEHISRQAKSLQNSEGTAFLDFFRSALDCQRPQDKSVDTREYCIELLPDWAPYLLCSADARIRLDAEQLIEDEIFAHWSPQPTSTEDDSPGRLEKEVHSDFVRRLGMKCVLYLRDVHVRQRAQIGRDAAAAILRTVEKCKTYHDSESDSESSVDMGDNMEDDFATIQNEVMGPLLRLVVDEMEDDVSGMLDGGSDSETAERDVF